MTARRRWAVVRGGALDTVARYLPSNYEATAGPDGAVIVTGHDEAGWTLDSYVLPRLASGLMWGREIAPDTPSAHTHQCGDCGADIHCLGPVDCDWPGGNADCTECGEY